MPNIYVNSNDKKNIAYLIFERKKLDVLLVKMELGEKIEKVILKHRKEFIGLGGYITEKTNF